MIDAGWQYTGLLFLITQLSLCIETHTSCNYNDIDIIIQETQKDIELYKSLPYVINLNHEQSIVANDDISFFEGKIDTIKLNKSKEIIKLASDYLLYEDQFNCYITSCDKIDNKFLYLSVIKLAPNLNNQQLERILASCHIRFEKDELHESILTLLLNRFLELKSVNKRESELLYKYLKLHQISIKNKILIEKCITSNN